METYDSSLNELIDPIKYESVVQDTTEKVINKKLEYIDKNVKLDKEENRKNSNKIHKIDHSITTNRLLISLFSSLCAISLLVFGFSFLFDDKKITITSSVACAVIGVISIVCIFVFLKRNKVNKTEKKELIKIGYEQMKDVNAYILKIDMISDIYSNIFSWLKIDSYLKEDKQVIWNKFLEYNNTNTCETYLSGTFNNFNFLIVNFLKMEMIMETYSGTKEFRSNSSNSSFKTEYYAHPAPLYYYEDKLFFESDIAEKLSFNSKVLNKKNISMENVEFDKYFGKVKRNDETQFRFLFTILTQENIVKLFKKYGQFKYEKNSSINIISNKNFKNQIARFSKVFIDYDYENFQENFKDKIKETADLIYVLFSMILSIPAFVHTQKQIAKKNMKNIPSETHVLSVLYTYFDKNMLCHSSTTTDYILEIKNTTTSKNQTVITVVAYSFNGVSRTKHVNGVEIQYIDYISLNKTTKVSISASKTASDDFKNTKSNNVCVVGDFVYSIK